VTGGTFQVQLFAKTPTSPVGWRLLSGNNRECGRAVGTHTDAEACRIAIKELQRDLPVLERRIRRAEPNRWTWELSLESGSAFVVSGHAFDRLIRCERAARQFADNFASAPVNELVVFTAARRWGSVAS
jgi:hypothetical protein